MNSRTLKIIMAVLMLLSVYIVMCIYLPAHGAAGQEGNVSAQNQSGQNNTGADNGDTERLNIDYTSKTVVIDSGHGGVDPGKTSADGILEKDINLAIAKKLEYMLKNAGVNVVMTRNEDVGLYSETDSNKKRVDMKKRCDIISECNADVVVSIHQNSYTSASVKGAQMFYYEGSEEGKKLAGILQAAFVEQVDSTNTRVEKADGSYYMLKNTAAPTVIAECGFLSNPQEAALLNSQEYQQKVAGALCSGILEYLAQQAE